MKQTKKAISECIKEVILTAAVMMVSRKEIPTHYFQSNKYLRRRTVKSASFSTISKLSRYR